MTPTSTSSSSLSETIAEVRRGFPVLLTAFLGAAVGMVGLSIYTLPFFVLPLEQDFGWSRREVLGAATAFTLGLIVTGPIVGRLIDRIGVGRVIPVSILLFCCGWLLLTQIGGTVWTLYGGYALIAALGAGTAYVAYAKAISTWFDKARGLALGVTMSGPGLTAALVPLVLPQIIAEHGWAGGYIALAIAGLLPMPLVLWVLTRRRAAATAPASAAAEAIEVEPAPVATGLTLKQALRTRQFWFLFLALVFGACAVIGTHLNMMALLVDRGSTQDAAAAAYALYGLSIIVGRLGVGVLLDRLPGGWVGAALFSAAAISMLILQFGTLAMAPIAAVLLGLAAGSESDVCGYLTSRYFGLKAFSEIFGWMFSAMALGLAVGPILGGWVHETFGNYTVWLMGGVIASMIAAALLASLGRYPDLTELERRP